MIVSEDGDRGDLDQRVLAEQSRHDDPSRRRVGGPAEDLASYFGRLPVVLRRRDELRRLYDVLERSPGRHQDCLELAEDLPRLGDDVATADDLLAVVGRRRARDEEQVAAADGWRKRVPLGPGSRTD